MIEDELKEINRTLREVLRLLDNHFNPPKKINWRYIITYLIIGAVAIWAMYELSILVRPLYIFTL